MPRLLAIVVVLALAPGTSAQIDLSRDWRVLADSDGAFGNVNRPNTSTESAEFSPDETLVASVAKGDNSVRLWRASDGGLVWEQFADAETESVTFTRDGAHVVTGGEDTFVRVWSVADDGQQVAQLPHDASVEGLRFSGSGDLLATGSEAGRLTLWDTSADDPADWPTTPFRVLVHGSDEDAGGTGDADVNQVDWTADDRFVVSGGRNARVRAWEVAATGDADQGLRETYAHIGSVKSVRLSPDDRLVAAGAGARQTANGTARVWDRTTGALVAALDFPDLRIIETVEWTPNGAFLFVGGTAKDGRQNRITIFRTADLDGPSPSPVEVVPAVNQEYFDFSDDGARLLVSQADGALSLYDVAHEADPSAQAPFGGTPTALPGRLEAERFDTGGPGVAYQDADLADRGTSAFRDGEAVDVFDNGGASGGRAVGWISGGEYLEFTVDVAQAGTYAVSARVATPQSSRAFRVEAGAASAAVPVPSTGGWTAWQTASGGELALAAGEQVVRLALTDGFFNLDYVDLTLVDAPVAPVTTQARVSSPDSDAEQLLGSGDVRLGSSDLDMATAAAAQVVGVRFALDVPQGATVTDAYVQFTAQEDQSGAADLAVRAQASDDAPAFSSASGDLTGRPRTPAVVAWSPGAWTPDAAGSAQRTPDLSGLVQAVVDRSGWQAGNHLALLVDGSGKRSAWSFEGRASAAPLLVVTYEMAGTARAAASQTGASTAGVTELAVFPNPASGRATVAFALPAAADVRVEVFDALGRRVAVVEDGRLGAGAHRLGLGVAGLPPGAYTVRAVGGGVALSSRVTVVR